MDNKLETEEERQDRYRKEVLDEINDLNMHSNIGKDVQSYGIKKKKSAVNFSKSKELNIKENDDNNSSLKKENEKMSSGNILFYFVCLVLIVAGIFSFPFINKFITKMKLSMDKEEKIVIKKEEKKYEKITLESAIINKIVYPQLHPDQAKVDNYYNTDKITVDKLSNSDILYNAFLGIYEGAILPYNGEYSGQYCGGSSKVYFSANYINLRVENIFNKKTVFEHSNFYVPKNVNNKYTGWWHYDPKNQIYIYYGDCDKTNSKYQYFDISVPYKVDSSEKNIDLYIYSYIGFVKVDEESKKYTIYRNSDYSDEISSGVLKTNKYKEELMPIFSGYSKNDLKKYKYSFSMSNCAYHDYCFVSGEWVK